MEVKMSIKKKCSKNPPLPQNKNKANDKKKSLQCHPSQHVIIKMIYFGKFNLDGGYKINFLTKKFSTGAIGHHNKWGLIL
jgi:hypothetical protein